MKINDRAFKFDVAFLFSGLVHWSSGFEHHIHPYLHDVRIPAEVGCNRRFSSKILNDECSNFHFWVSVGFLKHDGAIDNNKILGEFIPFSQDLHLLLRHNLVSDAHSITKWKTRWTNNLFSKTQQHWVLHFIRNLIKQYTTHLIGCNICRVYKEEQLVSLSLKNSSCCQGVHVFFFCSFNQNLFTCSSLPSK